MLTDSEILELLLTTDPSSLTDQLTSSAFIVSIKTTLVRKLSLSFAKNLNLGQSNIF